MNLKVILAVFKRNFAGYFSSPIGYVFICAFVLLTGFAAFWPADFFNSNLATLDQLNNHLPWIMLVFIPAITMSIWADERRQGTDELLLTLPCSDLDVVIGKYLAAVSIFTVALLFSTSNILVLSILGRPDVGVLAANYFGYWLVGAGMLSVGMVASFLTNSLTVGFILGMAFNAPLVFAAYAQNIVPWDSLSRFLAGASVGEQFQDFGRGVVSMGGIVFFASVVVVSLYLSMVLIGKRHWAGGPFGASMAGHYLVRTLSLVAVAIGANVLVARAHARADLSAERVNSLSPQTITMLDSLKTERPVYIEAYISPRVPEEYVQTRMNLLSMLREVDARGGDNIVVRIHDTERFSKNEDEAEQQFGIRPQAVQTQAGGKYAIEEIILGAAITSGLDKVVVPFFDRGLPAEYEVIRSIATVSQQQRKRIGVLTTDAQLFGGFDMQSMQNRPNQQIIDELQKQFEVVQVSADAPITEKFDALLAVQPSSLSPEQMPHFLAVVRSGQPTAIFEDPFPFLDANVSATSQPRQQRNRNPFQQQPPPQPKGDISPLWAMLGVQFVDREIVWQAYNPFPKLQELPPEFVFVSPGSGQSNAFNQSDEITSGMQLMMSLFAGSIERAPNAANTFTPLLQTGTQTGIVAFDDILTRSFLGSGGLNPNRKQIPTGNTYTLAARISGPPSTPPDRPDVQPPPGDSLNVILVSDIDVLYSVFFGMRARGSDRNDPVDITLDNVAFVLNVMDSLTGDTRFIDIRKRRPAYRTLTRLEEQTKAARISANEERQKYIKQFESKRLEEQQKLDAKLAELNQRKDIDPMQMLQEVAQAQQAGQNRLNTAIAQMEKDRDRELESIEKNLNLHVRKVQDRYKLAAVLLPAVPPLLVGLFVFTRRRAMEKVGVPRERLVH